MYYAIAIILGGQSTRSMNEVPIACILPRKLSYHCSGALLRDRSLAKRGREVEHLSCDTLCKYSWVAYRLPDGVRIEIWEMTASTGSIDRYV